ncbi:MAG: hypothetical protein IJ991_14495, partial [Thermoguttaceae bacterium]|nr:hypothetical protein [Thermoguttaceae bacterium]
DVTLKNGVIVKPSDVVFLKNIRILIVDCFDLDDLKALNNDLSESACVKSGNDAAEKIAADLGFAVEKSGR